MNDFSIKKMAQNLYNNECNIEEEKNENLYRSTVVFAKPRHFEKIKGSAELPVSQTYKVKGRMNTYGITAALCLNLVVDPPGIKKIKPCARIEAWVDPMNMDPRMAQENIGESIRSAYGKCYPRIRSSAFKVLMDPTKETLKNCCINQRRAAKEDKILFHYNGHGVPLPTANGEIWVFNKSFTQYIPLSMYALQTWLESPAIYVYDCSNAGTIVKLSEAFAKQHEEELNTQNGDPLTYKTFECIQLGACDVDEILPMNPDLPGDLFTACLTTPITIAIWYHLLQNKGKYDHGITLEMVEKIPGQLTDRRTILGELNWIFISVTDTIAWNTLPREIFQKLFRQDTCMSNLMRNFILAQRILRTYGCNPVSSPKLPDMQYHPMWHAWDLAIDLCLKQLPLIMKSSDISFQQLNLPFFKEQLAAFEVWLNLGNKTRIAPEQLPVVLQVTLSNVYRPHALELFCNFLSLGPWAINLVLSVGMFSYILRMLKADLKEHRPLLLQLSAKFLAVDPAYKCELVGVSRYFIQVLEDFTMHPKYRTLAAFVISTFVQDHHKGQSLVLQGNLLSYCLEQLTDNDSMLRQWCIICLGHCWYYYPDARWSGTRDNAHEKLMNLLKDPVPEVRAAVLFALGTFLSSLSRVGRSGHAQSVDSLIAKKIAVTCVNDGSPMVRQELVVALQYMVQIYEKSFVSVATQYFRDVFVDSFLDASQMDSSFVYSPNSTRSLRSKNDDSLSLSSPIAHRSSSLHSLTLGTIVGFSLSHSLYCKLLEALITLKKDPFTDVASLAECVLNKLKEKVNSYDANSSQSESFPGTPNKSSYLSNANNSISYSPVHLNSSSQNEEEDIFCKPWVASEFVEWSTKNFVIPQSNVEKDILSPWHGDGDNSVWDTDKGLLINSWGNQQQQHYGNITSTAIINAGQPLSYMCLGCDDGCVYVWRDIFPSQVSLFDDQITAIPYLVSAFRGSFDFIAGSRYAKLLMNWEQDTSSLIVGGGSKNVYIWDLRTEQCATEIHATDDTAFVSALSSSENGSWIVVGSVDGNVRLLDRRQKGTKAVVRKWKEHSSKVIHCSLFSSSLNSAKVISGAISGEVCLWDVRHSSSIQVCQPHTNILSMAAHPSAHLFAISSIDQYIAVYHQSGSKINTISHHEGFMGHKISPLSLTFHPRKVLLASGMLDNYISVYGLSSL